VFPATAGAAEYLVVPQLTAGNPGDQAQYRLGGDTINPITPSPTAQQLRALGSAERFHLFLRLGDERRWWGFTPEVAPQPSAPQPAPQVGPPIYNALRTFQVCAKLDCSRFDRVGARAKAINSKVAIFVDTLAPPGGLDSVALDSIARVFDQRLYAIDTAAFGRESDINGDSVVMVLMTNTVNKLVTSAECLDPAGGFVAGFFFGVDIDPQYRTDSRSNKAEVFYSIVADPAGTLSCPHSAAEVQAFVPVTFIHEFQHMISFNQHVLVRGANGELLWLNEGLSHYAEELGGRSYETNPNARINDCRVNPTATIQCRFYAGNLLNSYDYLDSTENHFLLPTEGIGSLAERGAQWLFVRYLLDRYAGTTTTEWNMFTRLMVMTNQVGAANVEARTGDQFEDIVSRWGLANWVTDLTPHPELKYDSWNMHAVFSSLHTQRPGQFPNVYPVSPSVSAGRDVALSGTLRSGSPIYHLATQPAGDPGFTLSFTAPNGALISSAMKPRLSVYRLQ